MNDQNKYKFEDRQNSSNSTIGYAGQYIKATLILNGGAALSILTLVGHVYSNATTSETALPTALIVALLYFGWGAALAVFTAFCAYVTQYFYTAYKGNNKRSYKICGVVFHVTAVGASLSSIVLFIVGMYSAVSAFEAIGS